MSHRATKSCRGFYPALVAIAACCLAAGTTFAQRSQPIQFSSPESGVVVSNLNQLGPKQSGLKQLEEDLSKSFESLNPDSSLGAVIAAPSRPMPRPPSRQSILSKGAKEWEDYKKNWGFMDPGELTKEPSLEKMFGLKEYDKNGQEKKPVSALEKYNQKLDRKDGGDAKEKTDEFGVDKDKDAFRDNDALGPFRSKDRLDTSISGGNNSEQLLKGLFSSDLDSKLEDGSTTFNGLPFSTLVKIDGFQAGRDTARDARMEEFKQLLAPRSAAALPTGSFDPFNQQTDPIGSSVNPAKILEPFTSPTRRDPLNQLQNGLNLGTVVAPITIQDFNSKVLGQPSLAPAFQPPPPKPQPPPQNFGFPTRKF